MVSASTSGSTAPQPPPRTRPINDAVSVEKRRENQRKLMEEMADVEILEDTLAKSMQLSAQMVDMLGSFDDRLKSFEQSMLPIHRSTQRLNLYYENVEKTLDEANRIIEYLDLADKERDVVSRGPDPANILPYIESMNRIVAALTFLTESRFASGEKAIYKLRQQQNAGLMQLIRLFRDWLTSISAPVDTLDLIRSQKDVLPTPNSTDLRRLSELATWLSSVPTDPSAPPQAEDLSDFTRVYVQVRGAYLTKSLQPVAAQAGDQRRQSSGGFIQLTTWLERYLRAERALATQLLPQRAIAVLDATATPVLDLYLEVGQALLTQLKRANGRADFSLVFVLFDVLEFWGVKRDEFGTVLDGLAKKSQDIEDLFDSWTKAALKIIPDFLEEVKQPGKGSLPPDGTVHELTSNTMSFMKKLLEYPDSTESILLSIGEHDWASSSINITEIKYIKSSGRLIRKYFGLVLAALDANLDSKAKQYKKPGVATIFLINNMHYILKTVRSHAKLKSLLSDQGTTGAVPDLVAQYDRALRRHRDAFQDMFRPVLEYLMDVTVIQAGAIKKDMSSNERAAIKDKFAKFNAAFDDVVKNLRVCAVPDAELKAALVKDAKGFVVPMYQRFLTKYQTSDFSKHKEKYIKYDLAQVEQILDKMFL
ncbi:Exocyst complex component 7 [Allomyces arbusculus]|nr:Exocyst complex component 7 [Allomyces arbusculus]